LKTKKGKSEPFQKKFTKQIFGFFPFFVSFYFIFILFLQEGFFLLFNNNFFVFLARIFKEVEH
jgi:hypothetical protein